MAIAEVISEDQLVLGWTLAPADISFISRLCRVKQQRLTCAVQLCNLKANSQYFAEDQEVPLEINNYLLQQMEYEPTAIPNQLGKLELKNTNKLTEYLGLGPFDVRVKNSLANWLSEQLMKKVLDQEQLKILAIDYLKEHRLILPSAITLGRIVATIRKAAYGRFYQSIVASLPEHKHENLASLITSKSDDGTTVFSKFKHSPSSANVEEINLTLDYIDELKQLGIYDCNLDHIDSSVISHLSLMGRCCDASRIKKLSDKNKRLSIVICFLYEARKQLKYSRILIGKPKTKPRKTKRR